MMHFKLFNFSGQVAGVSLIFFSGFRNLFSLIAALVPVATLMPRSHISVCVFLVSGQCMLKNKPPVVVFMNSL